MILCFLTTNLLVIVGSVGMSKLPNIPQISRTDLITKKVLWVLHMYQLQGSLMKAAPSFTYALTSFSFEAFSFVWSKL